MNASRALLAAVALALAAGCTPGAVESPGAQVVARVGTREITADALRAHLEALPAGSHRLERPGGSEQVLDEVVDQLLVEEASRRRDLSSDPDLARQRAAIRAAAKREEAQLLRRALLTALGAEADVSEEEARAHYEATKQRFRSMRVRLRMIRSEGPEPVREAAKRIAAGEAFAEVASQVNADPALRAAGGDLGPLLRNEVPADLRAAAFTLGAPGEVSEPFRTRSGWTLLQLVEREDAIVRPYAEVRDEVMRELRRKQAADAYAALLAELRSELGVTIDRAQLQAALPGSPPAVRKARVRPPRADPAH